MAGSESHLCDFCSTRRKRTIPGNVLSSLRKTGRRFIGWRPPRQEASSMRARQEKFCYSYYDFHDGYCGEFTGLQPSALNHWFLLRIHFQIIFLALFSYFKAPTWTYSKRVWAFYLFTHHHKGCMPPHTVLYCTFSMDRVWNNHLLLDRSSRAPIQLVNSLQPVLSHCYKDVYCLRWLRCSNMSLLSVCVCVCAYWPTATSSLRWAVLPPQQLAPNAQLRPFIFAAYI